MRDRVRVARRGARADRPRLPHERGRHRSGARPRRRLRCRERRCSGRGARCDPGARTNSLARRTGSSQSKAATRSSHSATTGRRIFEFFGKYALHAPCNAEVEPRDGPPLEPFNFFGRRARRRWASCRRLATRPSRSSILFDAFPLSARMPDLGHNALAAELEGPDPRPVNRIHDIARRGHVDQIGRPLTRKPTFTCESVGGARLKAIHAHRLSFSAAAALPLSPRHHLGNQRCVGRGSRAGCASRLGIHALRFVCSTLSPL